MFVFKNPLSSKKKAITPIRKLVSAGKLLPSLNQPHFIDIYLENKASSFVFFLVFVKYLVIIVV